MVESYWKNICINMIEINLYEEMIQANKKNTKFWQTDGQII